jgi:hypothetical protein
MTYSNKPHHAKSKRWLVRGLAGSLALAATLAIPAPRVASAQDAFIEIDAAPRGYESHPHTIYRGEPVYYVDGRWYARHGRGWAYYRDEPTELVRYRRVYTAPNAYPDRVSREVEYNLQRDTERRLRLEREADARAAEHAREIDRARERELERARELARARERELDRAREAREYRTRDAREYRPRDYSDRGDYDRRDHQGRPALDRAH